MTFTQPRYVIAVTNLERSTQYYRDVLGFSIQWQEVPGWRLFIRDSCLIMAGECSDALPATELGDHSYFAYIQVVEINRLHQELSNRGVTVTKPLTNESWGMKEFGIKTIDGHRMMFGEPCLKSTSKRI